MESQHTGILGYIMGKEESENRRRLQNCETKNRVPNGHSVVDITTYQGRPNAYSGEGKNYPSNRLQREASVGQQGPQVHPDGHNRC